MITRYKCCFLQTHQVQCQWLSLGIRTPVTHVLAVDLPELRVSSAKGFDGISVSETPVLSDEALTETNDLSQQKSIGTRRAASNRPRGIPTGMTAEQWSRNRKALILFYKGLIGPSSSTGLEQCINEMYDLNSSKPKDYPLATRRRLVFG